MKQLILLSVILFLAACGSINKSNEPISGIYDVSCGQCNYNMTGDVCELAIKINGHFYYVEGTRLHDHGDAHAEDGLCTVERKANVHGQLKKGVFVAESFELLPYDNQ